MSTNEELCNARSKKNDEFYTQLPDIEKEMVNYQSFFKDKVVYCNCDDPRKSQFFTYFRQNFEQLQLKQLICTAYNPTGQGFFCQYDGGNPEGEIQIQQLKGSGDFRSPECLNILSKADVVVTNPPFSLFREYLSYVVQYKKKFLIVGNMNAITCKEVFPLIKNKQLWYGPSISSGDRAFYVPDDYPLEAAGCGIDEEGKRYIRVKGVRWFTNIESDTKKPPLELYKIYSPEEFPTYDNYNAIEVSKTRDIPMDYTGVMGVPISFLDKYCPDQFEIIGITENADYLKPYYKEGHKTYHRARLNGKVIYARLLIRKKLEYENKK